MQALQNGRFAVSTWSLHRMLGATHPYSPDPQKSATRQEPYGPGTVSLLEVPGMLAERELGRVAHRGEVHCAHAPDAVLGGGEAGAELRGRLADRRRAVAPRPGPIASLGRCGR